MRRGAAISRSFLGLASFFCVFFSGVVAPPCHRKKKPSTGALLLCVAAENPTYLSEPSLLNSHALNPEGRRRSVYGR